MRSIADFSTPALAGIAALGLAAALREPPPRAPAPPAPAVRVIALRPATLRPELSAHGRIAPARRFTVAAAAAGRIEQLAADLQPGAHVAEGALLAVVGREALALAHAEANAALDAARAQADEMLVEEAAARRAQDLARRAVALAKLEDAKGSPLGWRQKVVLTAERSAAEAEAATARMPARRAALEAEIARRLAAERLAALRHAASELRAPFAARVAERRAEEGETVAAGAPILTLEEDARLEIHARAPHQAAAAFVEALGGALDGVEASIAPLGAGGSAAPARLQRLDLRAADASDRVEIVAEAVGGDAARAVGLGVGRFATLRLVGAAQTVAGLAPETAASDGAVWLVDAENRLRRRSAAPRDAGAGRVGFDVDPAAGAWVIVAQKPWFTEGARVRPIRDGALEAALTAGARP